MIRKLLATTAIATLLASGAVAQTTAPTGESSAPAAQDQQQQQMTIRAEGHLASNLIGESVYNGSGEEAENIGNVTDLVISQDGNIQAIVVGVGGFLGIGQKEVALEYNLVEWAEQQDGERQIVVQTTRDALESQQEFDRTAYRPMPADADVAETTPATEQDLAATPQQDQQQQQDSQQAAQSPLEGPEDQQQTDDTVVVTETEPAAEPDQQTAADQTQEQQLTDDQQTAEAPLSEGQQPEGQQQMAADQDQQQFTDDQQTAETQAPEGTQQPEGQQQMAADQDTAVQDQQQTAQTQQQTTGTDQVRTGAINQENLQEAQPNQLSADNLMGTTVYGANEENIGDINDVVLTPEGNVEAVVVDVGGFLGIGAKQVAVSMENLAFMTDENGDLYLYTGFTQEQLESQPAYDESTYAQQRDQMLLQNN